MITEEFLQKQIRRLKHLPRQGEQTWGDEKNPGLRDELKRALWRIASDDDHAREIIDRVMDTKPADGKPQFCPTPGTLEAFAEALAADRAREYEIAPTKCGMCGDSGFRQIVKAINGACYEVAVPCACKKAEVQTT